MQRRIALASAAMAAVVGISTCIAVSATTGAQLFGLHSDSPSTPTAPAVTSTVPSAQALAAAADAADAAAAALDDASTAPEPVYVRVREYYNQIVQVHTGAAGSAPAAPPVAVRSGAAEQSGEDRVLAPIEDLSRNVDDPAPVTAAPGATSGEETTVAGSPEPDTPTTRSLAAGSSTSAPATSATSGSTTSAGATTTAAGSDTTVHPSNGPTTVGPTSTTGSSTTGSSTIPAGIPPDSTIPRNWPIGKPLPVLPTAPTTCALWRLSMKGIWSCLVSGDPAPVTTVRAAEHRWLLAQPSTTTFTLSDGRVVSVPVDTSDD